LRPNDDRAEVRAAAAWLGERPVLGQEVFARGAPDRLGAYVEPEDEADVIAFLWASLALFAVDAEQLEIVAAYRPSRRTSTQPQRPATAYGGYWGRVGTEELLDIFCPSTSPSRTQVS
jgi:hypothetical protein